MQLGPGASAHGLGKQTIGLFRDAGSGGGVSGSPASGPVNRPFATTRTGPDGHFVFSDVPAGSWFVSVVGQPAVPVPGRWVRVTPSRDAHVRLLGCPECAPRLSTDATT